MPFDLVIKNGMVVDGSGLPAYPADIGVRHGRIDTIGRIRERAREVIDADGLVVAPGFVDGHTHMDAQIFWDPLGTSSCYHGITTVVMGNCGFTLAPCAAANKHLVIQNLQRAEDISPKAMEAGIEWRWTTYPEFLDVLDTLPKGINYAGYVGHSAVRTYVMGERAFDQAATEDDLQAMERQVRDAIRAGAVGFTTSRSPSHETPDGRPVASRAAAPPARSRDAQEARRGLGRARWPASAGHGAEAARLRLAARVRHRRGAAPHGGRGRARARPASGGDDDRAGAREGPGPLLPPARGQRGPGHRAPDHAQPARGHDVLRLRGPRLSAHGLVAPDPPALPLGAGEAGLHARASGPDADARARHAVGLPRPWARPPGHGRRSGGLRSGHDRGRNAGGGGRPPRRCPPTRAAHARHRGDGRERRGAAA